MTEMAPYRIQSPIGRERSPGGHQDDHDVRFGHRPVRDPRRPGLSAFDPPPGRLNAAARYLREELSRPEVAECRQDAEEAWAQARVHHRGGGRLAHTASAPEQQAAPPPLTWG